MKVVFSKGVVKELETIPKTDQQRIIKRIEALVDDPTPSGIKALHGNFSGYFRLRSGNYRIIYEIIHTSHTILILKIGHRKDIYDD